MLQADRVVYTLKGAAVSLHEETSHLKEFKSEASFNLAPSSSPSTHTSATVGLLSHLYWYTVSKHTSHDYENSKADSILRMWSFKQIYKKIDYMYLSNYLAVSGQNINEEHIGDTRVDYIQTQESLTLNEVAWPFLNAGITIPHSF